MPCRLTTGSSKSLARFCGFDSATAFDDQAAHRPSNACSATTPRCSKMRRRWRAETGSLVFTGGEDDPETIETLRRMGFSVPSEVSATIRGWHFGRYAATRSARATRTADRADAGAADGAGAYRRCRPGFPRLRPFPRGLAGGRPALLAAQGQSAAAGSDRHNSWHRAAPRRAAEPHRPKVLDAVLDPGFFDALPHPRRDRASCSTRRFRKARRLTRRWTAPASSARSRPSASACACCRKR